ncbi:hypothetical protein RN001_015540 [Aquatica leii]|uniref:Chromo domain-containing protein n=1 Tax=Aquatica leii TaxID=1421715 RepID=A0AAN7S6Q1_9COLE|nr:hypothetical protein RN001_015540 [Aquatica leii]
MKKREEVKKKFELLKQGEITKDKAFFPITKRLETISDQLNAKNTKLSFVNNKDEQNLNSKKLKHENTVAESTPIPTWSTKLSNLKKKIQSIKDEKLHEAKDQNIFDHNAATISNLKEDVIISEPSVEVDDYELDDLIEHSVEESNRNIENILDSNIYNEYLAEFDELPRRYIDAMVHDKKRQFDHRTGIRHDSFQEKFFIGTSAVEFIGSDIKVDEKIYNGTPGLYELLFKNTPVTYTDGDLHIYKEILDISNACRSNFDPNDEITNLYNNTFHRTIKMKPSMVNKNNEKSILQSAYSHIKIANQNNKFSLGDYVRISKYRNAFEKGYTPNWSNEIFIIRKVKLTNPTTYLLKDIKGDDILGGFYEMELQKVKHPDTYLIERILRKKGTKMYVKWLGFDETHNSWINKNSIA